MKLSINFLKDYIDLDENIDVKKLAEDMTNAGNEYDEAEKLVPATKLVIGKVLECIDHPDSDHLHCCKVDIGTEVSKIVCGAPNVRAGIKVIVALPGANLPGDVTIKAGIIRANRGDLLSILGMAYEIGAIYDKPIKPIDLSHHESGEDLNKSFNVKVNTENCSLFLARKALNVTIKESPDFIKNRLIASGIRPINNVVDISNYVMLECGQPLHFYDADRLGNVIETRMRLKEKS